MTGSWSASPRRRRRTRRRARVGRRRRRSRCVVVGVVVPVEATVVVSAPIEPSKTTAPQARTKVASVAATTRWRIRRIRRARAASFSWARAEGMRVSYRVAPPRAACEKPERMLGDAADDRDLRPRRRARRLARGVPLLRRLRVRQARPAAARADEELLPYIGPPFAYGFGELLGVAARRADRRRLHRRLPRALRDRVADRDDRRARHPRGARGAATATGSRSPPPSRYALAEPLLEAMGLREHFEVVAGPDLERPRRGQDRDARPRAARARPDPRGDGRRPLVRRPRRPARTGSRRSASPGASATPTSCTTPAPTG